MLNTLEKQLEKEDMEGAGSWFEILNKCEGTFAKTYKSRLVNYHGKISRNFNKGHSKYAGNNWVVTACDNKKMHKSYLHGIIQ